MSYSNLGFESSDLDDEDGGRSFGKIGLSYAPFSITDYPADFHKIRSPPKDGSTSADAHPRLRDELRACPWMKTNLFKAPNKLAEKGKRVRKGKAYCVACRCRVAVDRMEYHQNTFGHKRAEQMRSLEMEGVPQPRAAFSGVIPPPLTYPLIQPRAWTAYQPQPMPLFGNDISNVVSGIFPCPKCLAAFNFHNDVVNHVKDRAHIVHYGPTKVFPDCSVCGMEFESCSTRNRHMNETHHEMNVNYTNNRRSATKHLNVAETPFWVQLRHARYGRETLLDDHLVAHPLFPEPIVPSSSNIFKAPPSVQAKVGSKHMSASEASVEDVAMADPADGDAKNGGKKSFPIKKAPMKQRGNGNQPKIFHDCELCERKKMAGKQFRRHMKKDHGKTRSGEPLPVANAAGDNADEDDEEMDTDKPKPTMSRKEKAANKQNRRMPKTFHDCEICDEKKMNGKKFKKHMNQHAVHGEAAPKSPEKTINA